MYSMEDELIKKLKIPFENRTEDDLYLIERMVRKVEFFQKYFAEQIDLNYSHFFEHEYATQNTNIVTIDQSGDKFFVILQGQVGIYVKPSTTDNNISSFQLLLKVKQRFRQAVNNNKFKDYQINKINWHQSDLVLQKILLPGQSFGELALLNTKPREFTAIALQPCHFAYIKRHHFKEVMRIAYEKTSIKEMGFFVNLEIFEGWNVNSIFQIFKKLDIKHFRMEEVIYHSGDNVEQLYIIKEGQADLVQVFINDFIENPNDITLKSSPLLKQRSKGLNRRITTMTEHQFLGLEDLHSQEQKHKYTCIASSSNTILYVINKDIYEKKIYNQQSSQLFVDDFINIQNKYQNQRHSQVQMAVNTQRIQQQQMLSKIHFQQNEELRQFLLQSRQRTYTQSQTKQVRQSSLEKSNSQERSFFSRAKDMSLLGKVQTQSLYQNQAYKNVIKGNNIEGKVIHSQSTMIPQISPQKRITTTLNTEQQLLVSLILQQKNIINQVRPNIVKRASSTGNYTHRRVLRFQHT